MTIVSALAVTTHTLVGLPQGERSWLASVGTFETLAVTPRHDGQIDTVPWQVCQTACRVHSRVCQALVEHNCFQLWHHSRGSCRPIAGCNCLQVSGHPCHSCSPEKAREQVCNAAAAIITVSIYSYKTQMQLHDPPSLIP